MNKKIINDIVNLGISMREARELSFVSDDFLSDYEKLLKGYPIQYLIGYVDFCGNKINVDNRVLIPRYETEELCERVVKNLPNFNKDIRILDLCTGSGAIGITLKKKLNQEVVCSDISNDALEVAKFNACENGVSCEFILSDLFDKIVGKFDVIVCNPPYISFDENIMESVRLYEPNIALYAKDNGLYFYKKIISEMKKYLNDKFLVGFEIGEKQGDELLKFASNVFPKSKVCLQRDLSDRIRYLFIISE